MDRHHCLGYRRPFGAHVRHFVTDRDGRRPGCLLFEAAAKALPCRDRWTGWSDRVRGRRRHLMVVDSRHLVFPWVLSKNLASSVPAMAARRLADDRERRHGWRPAPCETFVDETRFRASCCRAASRRRVGETAAGRGKSVKGVCVMPLDPACRGILRGEREAGDPKPPTRAGRGRSAASGRRFGRRFETPGAAATAVAARGQGCRTTLCELREQCAAAGVALPQAEPPAASTACAAREKLDEAAFQRLRREILARSPDCPPWKGRRVLAVGGWRIALPRELAESGFRVPDGAHCPQGMAAPCRLRDRIPVDFDLFAHGNGRLAALTHLERAAEGDVIVHDRGCRSFAMAVAHLERGLDFVFRIQGNAKPGVRRLHRLVRDRPDRHPRRALPPGPDAPGPPGQVRRRGHRMPPRHLSAGQPAPPNPAAPRPLPRPPGHRGDAQERKIRDRMVPREVRARRAAGTLRRLRPALTLARRFSSRCDADPDAGGGEGDLPEMRANFRNGLRLVGREIEALFLRQAGAVRDSVARIMTGLSRCLQRESPGAAARRNRNGQGAGGPGAPPPDAPKRPRNRPRLPAHARSAAPFLSERTESLSECHWRGSPPRQRGSPRSPQNAHDRPSLHGLRGSGLHGHGAFRAVEGGLRRFMKPEHGIPSHDAFSRLSGSSTRKACSGCWSALRRTGPGVWGRT